jgi:hypothetical protein
MSRDGPMHPALSRAEPAEPKRDIQGAFLANADRSGRTVPNRGGGAVLCMRIARSR